MYKVKVIKKRVVYDSTPLTSVPNVILRSDSFFQLVIGLHILESVQCAPSGITLHTTAQTAFNATQAVRATYFFE